MQNMAHVLMLIIYSFNFCRFRALAYTALDRLLVVFFSIIFVVLLKFGNAIPNLEV